MSKCIKSYVNYRKIYEEHYGPIPKDETGRTYEIHHIDGNRSNNDISNLKCVSIQEHYDIHYSQKDYGACIRIAAKMSVPHEELSRLSRLHNITLAKNNLHPWQNTKGSEFRIENAKKRVVNNTHNFQGDRNPNKRRLENGTHNFLDKEDARKRARKQVQDGVHNFLGGEIQRRTRQRLLENGTHNFQQKSQCPHCNKIGMTVNMQRYHFDNCKVIKPSSIITCPHCRATGGVEGMKRWHFDNCRSKT